MNQDRAYYHMQRAKHINRRRAICHYHDEFARIYDEHRNLYWSD